MKYKPGVVVQGTLGTFKVEDQIPENDDYVVKLLDRGTLKSSFKIGQSLLMSRYSLETYHDQINYYFYNDIWNNLNESVQSRKP